MPTNNPNQTKTHRRRRGRPSKTALTVNDNLVLPDELYPWEVELLASHVRALFTGVPQSRTKGGN